MSVVHRVVSLSIIHVFLLLSLPMYNYTTDSDTLFPTSVMKNKDTINTATKYIQVCVCMGLHHFLQAMTYVCISQYLQSCSATMGSTDIWRPLRSLQLLSDGQGPVVGTDTTTLPPRSIFLISDGHMTEEGPTLDAVRQGVRYSRLFTFGVR